MEFEVLKAIPAPLRKAVRKVLPEAFVDSAKLKLINLLYQQGRVQHGPAAWIFVKRRILHALPTLYHLEIKITDHCNLRCLGCTNFSNIMKPHNLDVQEFTRDFERLSKLLKVSHIYLLGGEPLLHPEVGKFAKVARARFPHASVYVFTNCLLVPKISEDTWRDFARAEVILLADDYPVDIDRDGLNALAERHGVQVRWTEPRTEFFRVPIDLKGEQDVSKSFAACRNVDNCPNLRDGRLYPCGRVACMGAFREHYGVEGLKLAAADSLSIYDVKDAWEIMDFMLNPVPWCRHCDYGHMYVYPWQRGRDTLEQWTQVNATDALVAERSVEQQESLSSP